MAAASYYTQDHDPLLSHPTPPPQYPTYAAYPPAPHHAQSHYLLAHSTPQPTPSTSLKPLHLVTQTHFYPTHSPPQEPTTLPSQKQDARLKSHIRLLRFLSRALSLLLSLSTLIPMTLTALEFQRTKTTHRPAPTPTGALTLRTPWHAHTRTWPTYAYLSVAALSTLLHILTLLSYFCSVRAANRASTLASAVVWAEHAATLGVWIAAASVYRAEKNRGGVSDDLWGWACSEGAQAIQAAFRDDVDFNRSCHMQSGAWGAGLAQVAAGGLTGVVYGFVFLRARGGRGGRGGKAGM